MSLVLCYKKRTISFFGLILFSVVSHAQTRIFTSPESVLSDSNIILHTILQHESACGSQYKPKLSTDGLFINIRFSRPDDLVCSEQHIEGLSTTFQNELGPLSAGAYQVTVYDVDSKITGNFELIVDVRDNQSFNLESPAAGQIVSGIGLIRGWACDRYTQDQLIQYQIDNGDKQIIPHGSDRFDTKNACGGFANNGWGAVVNWNNYTPGTHNLTMWFNGKKMAGHEITVAKHSASFLTGISREATVENFPGQGEQTKIEWSEANQNFIIIETK